MLNNEQRKIMLNAYYGRVTSCYADTDSVKKPHIDGRDRSVCMYDVYEQLVGFKRRGECYETRK